MSQHATPTDGCHDGDLTRLACLWSQQELCGRRPAKVDPFAWACHEPNIDSFLLSVKLKQLPKAPSFREAVEQQRRTREEEAVVAKNRPTFADRLSIQLPVEHKTASYSMFDDAEGDDWQIEPDDWLQQDEEPPMSPVDVAYEATSPEGESVQAALNARLRRTTRLRFFDDESGEEGMQLEPDDFAIVTGMVDRRGWPEFSKAA